MALPNGAGGYQLGDGNLGEAVMGVQSIPTALTGDTTLTAAQLLNGLIICSKASDATLTLTTPTGTAIDTALPSAKVNSSFEVVITNTNDSGASSTVPITAGTGVTFYGAVTVARLSGSTYRFVRTGTGTWSAFQK